MLRDLGLPMARHRPSGVDISCFLWCGRNSIFLDEPTSSLFFFFAVFVILSVLDWALPHLSILNGTLQGGIPWVALSVSLNVIVTSMICFRLLRMRALLRRELGPDMSRTYTNTAAMVVESSAPFTILGIGVLVTVAHNGPLSYAFGYVWTIFYVCSVPSPLAYSLLRATCGRG